MSIAGSVSCIFPLMPYLTGWTTSILLLKCLDPYRNCYLFFSPTLQLVSLGIVSTLLDSTPTKLQRGSLSVRLAFSSFGTSLLWPQHLPSHRSWDDGSVIRQRFNLKTVRELLRSYAHCLCNFLLLLYICWLSGSTITRLTQWASTSNTSEAYTLIHYF